MLGQNYCLSSLKMQQLVEQIRWQARSIDRKVIAVRVPGGITPP